LTKLSSGQLQLSLHRKIELKKKTTTQTSQTYNYFGVVEEGHCSHIKSFEVGHVTFSSNRLRLGSSSSEMDGG